MEESRTAGRSKRYILVIDSNVDDRFQTGMLVQRFGYDICTASSASDAIDFMHVAPPAAIVTEAGLTGAGLVSRIKKDARFSDIPVILLTATPDLDLEIRARKGEFACLRKPLDVEKFYQAFQAAVEKTPRKNIRIGTSLEARLENIEEGGKGRVSVLSEYGLFFRTHEPRELNERVTVSFTIRDRTIKVEAVVLYSYALEASPFREPGMGMKFVKIGPEDQAFIRAFILEEVQEGIRPYGHQP